MIDRDPCAAGDCGARPPGVPNHGVTLGADPGARGEHLQLLRPDPTGALLASARTVGSPVRAYAPAW